tara:strand:+ start:590 stop:730 length:141 start_codon:yes stop_codon:yes gene_type:complete
MSSRAGPGLAVHFLTGGVVGPLSGVVVVTASTACADQSPGGMLAMR